MMSVLSVVFVCVAGLHLAAAAFVAMHHSQRPLDTSFRPLAMLSVAQSVAAIGTAVVASAEHHVAARLGQQFQYVGTAIAIAAFSWLVPRIANVQVDKALIAIRGWSVAMVVAVFSGLWFTPLARDPRRFGLAWVPDFAESEVTRFGIVLSLSILPVVVFVFVRVVGAPKFRLGQLETRLAVLLAVLALVNDALVRFGPLRSIYVTEIIGLVIAFNANRHLSRRFRTTTDDLAVHTAELELSVLELRQMHLQLARRQQLAAVGEFSAVIAHEVRNPLAIIKNAVSTLRRDPSAPADPDLLGIVNEEVTRLQRLVNDLFAYTRPLVPQLAASPAKALLNHILARARAAHVAVGERECRVTCDEASSVLHGDPDLVEIALINVIANAAQATDDGGTITLEVATLNGGVEIRVTDTGPGMPAEVMTRAKEPFYTTRSTGTGLGLAIVDRVMRAHGGSFNIESDAGGTRITLHFPDVDVARASSGSLGSSSSEVPENATMTG